MDAETFEGFAKLDPAKAAAVLPGFKQNVARLMELRDKQFQLLRQLIFHVTLKAHGVEAKDVQSYVYEHTIRRRKVNPDGGEPIYETVDAVDWKTGYVKYTMVTRKTGRIAGVLLKVESGPARVLKFDEPVDHWT